MLTFHVPASGAVSAPAVVVVPPAWSPLEIVSLAGVLPEKKWM